MAFGHQRKLQAQATELNKKLALLPAANEELKNKVKAFEDLAEDRSGYRQIEDGEYERLEAALDKALKIKLLKAAQEPIIAAEPIKELTLEQKIEAILDKKLQEFAPKITATADKKVAISYTLPSSLVEKIRTVSDAKKMTASRLVQEYIESPKHIAEHE